MNDSRTESAAAARADVSAVAAAEASLLVARARALAREDRPAAASVGEMVDVLEFGLSDETYAFELTHVREVSALVELTPLPGVPRHILGISCVHGGIIAVLDLRKLFGLAERGLHDSRQMIVLQSAGMDFGVLAERIAGVRRLSLDSLQPSLPTLNEVRAAYLRGITPDGTVVLSAARLLADPQLVVSQNI
jgi:purine-binding chemotaxis protein CheW